MTKFEFHGEIAVNNTDYLEDVLQSMVSEMMNTDEMAEFGFGEAKSIVIEKIMNVLDSMDVF